MQLKSGQTEETALIPLDRFEQVTISRLQDCYAHSKRNLVKTISKLKYACAECVSFCPQQ